jgi:hypothetical protein
MTDWLHASADQKMKTDMQIKTPDVAANLPARSGRGAACAVVCLVAMLSSAGAAPPKPSPEDRYIAARDAAIEKFSPIYDAGKFDDTAKQAEEAAFADLKAQMSAILDEPDRKGFGPAKLNIETFYKGDEGFGTVDGLRFDAEMGETGEKAGGNGADGKYVEPKAHIVVTTQTMFARWLRAHKDWWDKGASNVPQQIGSALKDESFYTQAISNGSAVVSFNTLPITRPASATFTHAFLAARTQDDIPNAADEVIVSALANGKVYIAEGSIAPKVQVAACTTIRADYNKRAEAADDDFRFKKIDKKASDELGDLRQQGEDAYKRCFAQRAPQQPAFAKATGQAQALLAAAMGK